MVLIKSRYLRLVQICVIFLFALYLLSAFDLYSVPNIAPLEPGFKGQPYNPPPPEYLTTPVQETKTKTQHDIDIAESTPPQNNTTSKQHDLQPPPNSQQNPPNPSLLQKAHSLLPSILSPETTSTTHLTCPPINKTRYSYLRPPLTHPKPKYIFTLNLRQCVDLLPRLLGSLLQTITFLGPPNCIISIIEGNSSDGTLEVLRLLRRELLNLGVRFYLSSSSLNPKDGGQRIKDLALLRALAIEAVIGEQKRFHAPVTTGDMEVARGSLRWEGEGDEYPNGGKKNVDIAPDAIIIFINDVAACPDDLLELIHQHKFQQADMVCAMDWLYNAPPEEEEEKEGKATVTFYDIWVSRAINGDIFFDIPPETASWEHSSVLFPTEPVAQARFKAGLPFQVFSCWNGAVVFKAARLVDGLVGFRWPKEGECFQGEPQLFCKDLWGEGFGRIAVVPSVNLGYGGEVGRLVKGVRGFVGDFIADGEGRRKGEERIGWVGDPPERVKCMPDFKDQRWLRWNESFGEVQGGE